MAKSDALFQLIKSMTKTEKRYFKLTEVKYQSEVQKDYLRLFDAIEEQQLYDEEALIAKFRNEPYFKQLKDVKLYLYRKILKSLRNFYDDVSIDMELNNALAEIEILYRKELFENCASAIRRAKKYAEKYEKLSYLLKIIDWEIKVADYINAFGEIDSLKQKVINKAREAVDSYSEIIELRRIYLEYKTFFLVEGEPRVLNGKEAENPDKVPKHPLLERQMKSFQGENFRLVMIAQHARAMKDIEAELSTIENIIALYDANPCQIQEQLNGYFNYLVILADASIKAKKFIKAGKLLLKLKDIYEREADNLNLKNRMEFLCGEADFRLKTSEFGLALDLIPKIKNLVETAGQNLDADGEFYVYSLLYTVHFNNADFKKAQEYVQKIINHSSSVRLDMQSSARIVNLILQYEQREYEHLGYVLRSTYRFLMKKQRLYEPEISILDFFKKAVSFASEKQVVEVLTELKAKMLPHIDEAFITGFPIIEWIDSKLQKKTLVEIVRQRYLVAVAKEEAGEGVIENAA